MKTQQTPMNLSNLNNLRVRHPAPGPRLHLRPAALIARRRRRLALQYASLRGSPPRPFLAPTCIASSGRTYFRKSLCAL